MMKNRTRITKSRYRSFRVGAGARGAAEGLIDGRCFEKTIQHKIVNKDKKKIEDLERIYNEHILAYKTSAQDNWERLKLHLNS